MSKSIKIIGAGSMGNHLTFASRKNGWNVTIVDIDQNALIRMKNEIYPTRYGKWDDSIILTTDIKINYGSYDVIAICTPPDIRLELGLSLLEEKPRILQLEKPISTPNLYLLDDFIKKASEYDVNVLTGYNHVVSKAISELISFIKNKKVGEIYTIDSYFRENWSGIFKAHPWLNGPQDSYLGFSDRGGGASGEHSHALHLWLTIAMIGNIGEIEKINFFLDNVNDGIIKYDRVMSLQFKTNLGKIGHVIQDVVTTPTEKRLRITGEKGIIEWIYDSSNNNEYIDLNIDGSYERKHFKKNRSDDFYEEILHIDKILKGDILIKDSVLSLKNAIKTVKILSYIHGKNGAFDNS